MMYKKFIPVCLLIVLATTLASAGLNPFAKKKSNFAENAPGSQRCYLNLSAIVVMMIDRSTSAHEDK